MNEPFNFDSEEGVKILLKDILDPSLEFNPDIIEPDPWVKFVWIAIDTKNKKVMIVYLWDKDAEEIPYISSNCKDYLS